MLCLEEVAGIDAFEAVHLADAKQRISNCTI